MSADSRREFLQQLAGAAAAWPVMSALTRAADSPRPRIKIGQIGTTHAHASKLGVYRKSADYEVVGVVEPDPQRRAAAEKLPYFQGVKWISRDELLNTPGLQAVLVETDVCDLLNNAEVCVAAGKHIHFDKPAGESLPQFKRILDDAKRQKLIVQMGYMYRYNPGIVLLRDLLKKGWLGEVFEIEAVMSKVLDPQDRREIGQYPGGIMFELGCHIMDLTIGVLGKPDRLTGYNRHSSPLDDALLDNSLAVLEYPRAIATVKTAAVEIEGNARRHFTVCGTEGTLQIQPLDNPSARLALSKPRGDYKAGYQDVALPKYTRYVDDAADMAQVIRGEKEFGFSYEHDLNVQTAVLQASGRPLDV